MQHAHGKPRIRLVVLREQHVASARATCQRHRLRRTIAILHGARDEARVQYMLIFNRFEGRQVDAQKAFLNCIFDKMPLQLRLLLF